jgi:hypothetical protein
LQIYALVVGLKPLAVALLTFYELLETPQRRNDTLNCWGLLERIMGETNVALSDFSFRGTALYEKEYGSGSVDKPETKTRFLQGAMDFLESQYTQFVQNYIAENVSKAQAGGQPAEASRVKAYLNVIFDRRNQGSFPNHLEVRPFRFKWIALRDKKQG